MAVPEECCVVAMGSQQSVEVWEKWSLHAGSCAPVVMKANPSNVHMDSSQKDYYNRCGKPLHLV